VFTKKIFDELDDVNDYGEIDRLLSEYASIVGRSTISYEDTSYINEVIQQNLPYFESGELSGKLNRPTLSNFVLPYYVYEIETVVYDYEIEIDSYGSNPSDAIKIKDLMDDNGDLDIYQNSAQNREVVDSEMSEIKWDKENIRKREIYN
jgi:hypothetical protein